MVEDLRPYLLGWRAQSGRAATPRVFRDLDPWIRHRLRGIQLGQWVRSRTTYRELIAVGWRPEVGRHRRGQHPPLVAEWRAGASSRPSKPSVRRAWTTQARRVASGARAAPCGPACRVVWEGSGGDHPSPLFRFGARLRYAVRRGAWPTGRPRWPGALVGRRPDAPDRGARSASPLLLAAAGPAWQPCPHRTLLRASTTGSDHAWLTKRRPQRKTRPPESPISVSRSARWTRSCPSTRGRSGW
ncbi:MAG: hypothetical protein R3F39_07905 [Myxococcota bacterium]